ncbi:MAG TPA: 2-phosphosulfolactate phosphatase, partial [Bacteroidales bacterium]|nr:2-phosphosulfolactate phosphatase [Bacteroidales bacterium]
MYLQKKIQVCFSPALLSFFDVDNNTVILIIDVLRATTSICTAFQNNVKEIIPVATLEEAKEYKLKGFIVAAERDGIKADFADFGNSPFNFMNDDIKDQTLVYST